MNLAITELANFFTGQSKQKHFFGKFLVGISYKPPFFGTTSIMELDNVFVAKSYKENFRKLCSSSVQSTNNFNKIIFQYFGKSTKVTVEDFIL